MGKKTAAIHTRAAGRAIVVSAPDGRAEKTGPTYIAVLCVVYIAGASRLGLIGSFDALPIHRYSAVECNTRGAAERQRVLQTTTMLISRHKERAASTRAQQTVYGIYELILVYSTLVAKIKLLDRRRATAYGTTATTIPC